MPIPGPTPTLTPGTTVSLTPPIAPTVGQAWTVELDNVSPYPCSVNISGGSYWLAPFTAQLYSGRSGPAEVSITPQPAPDGSPAPQGSASYLLSTWAQNPDSIPGVFPYAITGPALEALAVFPTGTPTLVSYSARLIGATQHAIAVPPAGAGSGSHYYLHSASIRALCTTAGSGAGTCGIFIDGGSHIFAAPGLLSVPIANVAAAPAVAVQDFGGLQLPSVDYLTFGTDSGCTGITADFTAVLEYKTP